MTLYELTNSMTIQGNICVTIYDANGKETDRRFYYDLSDFVTYHEDADDLDDFVVTYIYADRAIDGGAWLNIELQENE